MKKFLLVILPIFIIALIVSGFFVFKKEKPVEPKKEGGEIKVEISGKKVLMVLAPKDFRDEEYQEPRTVLEEVGAQVMVASKGVTTATGKLGATVAVDQDLAKVKVEDYDAIIFVGGPGSSVYFDDQEALALAKKAYDEGKVVGAICIAPSILANAGILEGKQATAFPTELVNLKRKGATYTGKGVTVDGKIITARGPEAASEFGQKLVEVLSQ